MLGLIHYALWAFTPLQVGCPEPEANVSNTLEEELFIEAGICPYADVMTLPIFATIVLVGLVNVPVYIRSDSIVLPLVVTLTVGGVLVTQASGLFQTLMAVTVTVVFGIGPVLLLMRIQR